MSALGPQDVDVSFQQSGGTLADTSFLISAFC